MAVFTCCNHISLACYCNRSVKTPCRCLLLTQADLDWTEASCFESSLLSPASILQIIQVNLTSDVPKPLTPGTSLEFTYSVRWEASTIPFAKRFERYLDYNFFEHQVTCCGGRGSNQQHASACLYLGVCWFLCPHESVTCEECKSIFSCCNVSRVLVHAICTLSPIFPSSQSTRQNLAF